MYALLPRPANCVPALLAAPAFAAHRGDGLGQIRRAFAQIELDAQVSLKPGIIADQVPPLNATLWRPPRGPAG